MSSSQHEDRRALRAWAELQASRAPAVSHDQVREIVTILRNGDKGRDRDEVTRRRAS